MYRYGQSAQAFRSNLVVGTKSLPDNPHDSHTLKDALRPVQRLTGQQPERC